MIRPCTYRRRVIRRQEEETRASVDHRDLNPSGYAVPGGGRVDGGGELKRGWTMTRCLDNRNRMVGCPPLGRGGVSRMAKRSLPDDDEGIGFMALEHSLSRELPV